MFWYALAYFIGTSIVSAYLTKGPKNATASSMGDVSMPTAEEGRSVTMIFGTCLVEGPNVVSWGGLYAKPIKQKSGGFLGIGAKNVTIAYKYYLRWVQMALCTGEVDELVDIIAGDKSLGVSASYAAGGTDLYIDHEGLFGGEKKEGGLSGHVGFYFGSRTQAGDAHLAASLGVNVPGYRNVCHAVLKNFYIGTTTYPKSMSWVLRRCPAPAGLDSYYRNIGNDANPAYMAVAILTHPRVLGGLGLSESRVDLASFQSGAITLYNEGFGMSLLCDTSKQADAWMDDICNTIDAVIYRDPSTGLFTLKLIRADYNPATLPVFDGDPIIGTPEINYPDWPETLNKLTVRYMDRSAGFVVKTAQDKDAANRAVVGLTRESTQDFMGVSNATIAQKIAARELRGAAYPFASVNLVLNREGWALRPGSPFKLTWPPRGITEMVCRVANIRYGTFSDGRIPIEAVQDTFTAPASLYTKPPASDWVNPIAAPVAVAAQMVLEAPYWLLGESRNVLTLATEADACYRAEVWTDDGGGYAHTADMPAFTPSGLLSGAYSEKTLALDATGFLLSGTGLDRLESTSAEGRDQGVNMAVFADTGEIISWTTITDNGGGSYTIAGVLRGMLDTVPAPHAAGARVYFLSDGVATTLETADTGGSGGAGAPGINGRSYEWHDEWDPAHPYEIDNTVAWGGSSYVATLPSTNKRPDLFPTYWGVLARAGEDGVSDFTRATASATTASLASGATEDTTLAIRSVADLLSITTDYAAWIRVYGTAAQRTADAARLITDDPAPGAGCFFDGSTAAGALTIACSPVPVFVNGDGTPADVAYVAIKNLSPDPHAITLDIVYLPQEA